jgi:hypothetical protein
LRSPTLGKKVTGTVTLTPTRRAVEPWTAQMRARTDQGDESVTVRLDWIAEPPKGTDAGFRGEYAGMTMTVLFKRIEERGLEVTVNARYQLSRQAPARDQAHALRFLVAMHGKGELVIRDPAGRATGVPGEARSHR